MDKKYKLLDSERKQYLSDVPGELGGNKLTKIYGRLNCPVALRWIKKGGYIENRVFFANEEAAIAAGYRPCGICMKEEYMLWKESKRKQKEEK